ncbi:arginine--tRNA ligase [Candidatus Margulisiibacteriota bacterium]
MLKPYTQHIETILSQHIDVQKNPLIIEFPQSSEHGELATPICFNLAKEFKKAPRQIAQDIVEKIKDTLDTELFEKAEAAGGGYINFFINKKTFIKKNGKECIEGKWKCVVDKKKVLIEHTNINPNKAAHVGHLRNAVLGDTLQRLYRYLGHDVQVTNYIDDTGVQVADVIVGFEHIAKAPVENIENMFDYYCWDLYAEVQQFYDEDKKRLDLRNDALHALEKGEGKIAQTGRKIAEKIVQAHLATMRHFGIDYDALIWESSLIQHKLWNETFEKLKEKKVIEFSEAGDTKGCWVMSLAGAEEFENLLKDEKIIVRSNGTATYNAKDISFQLWKFGKLEQQLDFALWKEQKLFSTHVIASERSERGNPFGQADKVINVIDVRQSYLQNIVTLALEKLGMSKEAKNSIHYWYEMVTLSPKCVRDLGLKIEKNKENKSQVSMSGRKGLGVKIDDLRITAEKLIAEDLKSKDREYTSEEINTIAQSVACGAIRYFMLNVSREQIIQFDFDQVLSFEGNTGAYLQYAVVRMQNILENNKEKHDIQEKDIQQYIKEGSVQLIAEPIVWDVIAKLIQGEKILENTSENLQLSQITQYAYSLAKSFSGLYSYRNILNEPDDNIRLELLSYVYIILQYMKVLFSIMGIPVLNKM